jgi:imidazolonepropionase-like amidohydrolase
MIPVIEGKIPVMVHANEFRQIKSAIEWAETNRFKIILAGGRDAWRVAELLAAKKIPVIFENTFEHPVRDFDAYDVHFKAAAILHKAGVRVIFSEGTGPGPATQARNLPYAAAQSVAFGLPHEEALKGLTLYPAELFQVANRLGSIETGKDATLIAATGDILDVRSLVTHMWIAGAEVPLESRHTRLYEKYRNRPRP